MIKGITIKYSAIWAGGVIFILLVDELLMSMNNSEPFSLMPIVFGLLLYCVLEFLITKRFKPVASQIRKIFVACLIFVMLLNIGILIFGEEPFLFSDDKTYNEAAKAISQGDDVFTPLIYSGGYYYRFLGFLYRVVGPFTLNGRLFNLFCLFIITIIGWMIINLNNNSRRGKYFVCLLLFYCPAFVYFSLFEFKDMIFTAILFGMLYFCKKSHCHQKMIGKVFSFGLAVFFCYVSWLFRVGVGCVFILFNLIPLIINQGVKTKKITLTLALLCVYLISFITANFTTFAGLLPEQENRISVKLIAYSNKRLESGKKSNLQQYLIMKEPRDILKAPVSVALIPFAPVSIFDAKDLVHFLFAQLGFFTLIIYLGLLFAVVKRFKILKVDYYSVLLPTMICLIILTWFNAGNVRHFIFLIPLLILTVCMSNIDIRKMMFNGFMLTLSLYALYYSLKLKETMNF